MQAAQPTATPADRVLYWAYTSAVFDEAFANDAYTAALDELIASLQRPAPHLGLFGGLANAGWVLCHTLDAEDSEDALGTIDEALLRVLGVDEWRGAHDLIEGLVGFGVYFLERLAHGAGDRARDGLARVVTHLERTALACEVGATWHTPLALLPPRFAADYPDGFFDCGVAHGVPGMIGLLARAGDHVPSARPLALAARRWLAAQRNDGAFPARLAGPPIAGGADPARGARFEAARTAWCYGDPGIALGLWAVRDALGAPDPGALALAALRRDAATARVVDATLCHGAAGLGHLAHRFFVASRDPAFAEVARTWFSRALALPIPAETAVLDGSAGVGLALVAAATSSEPGWDRLLLSDLAYSEPEG